MKIKKQTYIAPTIEIIEVENEGVMAASNLSGTGIPNGGYGGGGNMFSRSTRSTRANPYQTSSTLGELEDMINDILTVKSK